MGLDPDPAAVRLGETARDRQAESGPAGRPGERAALERLEDPLRLTAGYPGPVVDDADQHLRTGLAHLYAHRLVERRVAQRVLDEVRDDPLGLDAIRMDERRVVLRQYDL